jgi:hypothetical protein
MREVLTTSEINSKLNKYDIFKGVFPSDRLKILNTTENQAYIINSEKHNMSGEHWLALIISNDECNFFDSYGFENLNMDILLSLKKAGLSHYNYNNRQLQPLSSNNCGHYCVAFVLSFVNGYTFCDFLNIFSNNSNTNDAICYKFIKNHI